MRKAANLMEMPDGTTLGKGGDYLDVDDASLYYEMHGSGEPLLLLHGAWSSVEGFLNQAAPFCQEYRIIIPERRGHGRSPDTPGEFTYAQAAEDMCGLLSELGIGRAHLMGWSAGAIVGLMMGMERPDLVASFVSVSGTFNRAGYTERFRTWFENSTPNSLGKVMREIYRRNSPDGPEHFPEFFEKVKRQADTHPDYTVKDLEGFAIPTLVLAADRDIIRLDHTMDYFKSLPRGQLGIVPGATHMLPIEKPELLNMLIIDFLRDHQVDR